jgi:hypothetical protein
MPTAVRRCPCGFTRFRERLSTTETLVQRWVPLVSEGDFGGSPLGVGLGSLERWGLFEAPLREVQREVRCESCGRLRAADDIGGIAVFALYSTGDHLVVVASDLRGPASCYTLRLEGPETHHLQVETFVGPMPELALALPLEVADEPPAGAPRVDVQLRAWLPEVSTGGEYSVTLVDRCAEAETALGVVLLEEAPMLITPSQADLGGAPELWLRQNFDIPVQGASGSGRGIPLEYCAAVIEYDARLGTLPDAQGWSHQDEGGGGAPSDWALVAGRALYGNSPGVANPSYWRHEALLTSVPEVFHTYAAYRWVSDGGSTDEEGLHVRSMLEVIPDTRRRLRWSYRQGELFATLSGSESAWSASAYDPRGWHYTAASRALATPEQPMVHNGAVGYPVASGPDVGMPPVIVDNKLVALFGDVLGAGLEVYLRNVVVSTPGRFIRPFFAAAAPAATPTLRLFLVSDIAASLSKTARLLVRYGGGDPYALPGSQVAATLNFINPNQVYELAFSLPGLTPGSPFWFTVEREWGHAEDALTSAVWLQHATVRRA